ncbi:UNVERIFIED_CONTAM: hypothetical protein K2H54_043893, partial [Gekko kuhli]
VLKCKKDKIYEDGQLCPKCTYPKHLQTHDIQHLKDISCTKPIIQSPLKLNISHNEEEEEEEEDDDSSEFHSKEFQLTPWNITLNVTDEHGNIVNLDCEIKKPTDSTKIQWNPISPQEMEINASISLDMECLMNREDYEKLWKLIAYYSEVPVKLEREHMLSREPKLSYHYRQGSDYDALYYTGVKGRIFAEPAWLMQPLIHIQLNRRQSTGKKVVLSFSTNVSQTLQTQSNKQQRNSWVMIEQDLHTKAVQSVVEGSNAQLSCNVKATESPSIKWLLPDGTKLKAPFKMEDSRFSVLSSGQLVIKSVAYADSGVYHCVAQVRGDIDSMSYRILVQPPVIQPADSEIIKVQKNMGEPILLPCSAEAIPDAHLSWILPNSHVLSDLSNSSNGYLLDNGSLFIPLSHVSDSGYYRCVAINQQGSDQFAIGVTVNKMVSDRSSKSMKLKRRPGSRTSVKTKVQVIDDDEGSGAGESDEMLSKKFHLKNHEVSLKQRNDHVSHVKKNKKGKRKMKLWKGMDGNPEINVAEGRRVFESRRRINMANKQINPQHWANILAKVRSKNLPRTTVAPVPSLRITTETPLMHKTTRPPPPIVSPPQKTTIEPSISGEESSGDISHLGETEPLSVTVPHIIDAQDYNQFPLFAVVSAEPELVVEHRSSDTTKSTYLVETPIAKDSWISPTVQSHYWEHSDLRTDYYPTVANTFTKEHSNEEVISSQPYILSTLITAHKGVRTTQHTFSSVERPLEADVFTDNQASESSKITSTIFMPASPFKDSGPGNDGSIEHQRVNKNSDPNHVLEGVTLENIHIPIPESVSVLESTAAPFKKSDWLMTVASANKLTTMPVILDHGRKSTTSDSQVPQHSRRRPYGRRRLRPNRFRRPRPIPPSVSPLGARPYIQNTSKTEATTQSFQRYIYHHHKPDAEAANEHKPLEESSVLMASATALQKSIKVHDLEAVSVLSLTPSQPRTTAMISNVAKEQKSRKMISPHDALTTAPNPELFLYPILGHKPATSTANEFIKSFEGNMPTTSYEGTVAYTPGSSVSNASFTSPISSVSSIPEFEEGSVVSSSPENRVMSKAPQSRMDIVPHWTTVDSTAIHFMDPPDVDELQKSSGSLTMTTITPFSKQRETETSPHYSTIFDDLLAPPETKQTVSLLHNKAKIITSSSHTKEMITQLQDHHDQTAVNRTETNYSPVLPIAFAPLATTLSPLESSTPNWFDRSTTMESYTSSQVMSPDLKGSSADNIRAKVHSRQNELFFTHSNQNRITTQQKQVQLKESSGSRTFNSLAPNPKVPHQPMRVIPIFNQSPAFSPPKLPHVRGALMTANTRIQRFEVLKNGTFIIHKVHLQDRGQYLCMAQNLHGVDKMIVLLTVLAQQPKILGSRFRDVTVYFGEKVTMDCQATGIPSPHISWIFPDRKILQTVSTTEGRVMLYENRTLSLKDTNFSDRGVYKCIASNAAGADSTAVRLHIAALPPIIQQEKQQNISLNVGQNINIHCSAKAAPLPSIRWVLFDGTQIRTSQFVHGNLFVFPNGTLYIRNVSPKDSGSYECIAANMVGAARRSVWLHVKKQSTNARITGSSPQRTDVTYGGTLRLDCSASGDPWPRILWRLPSKRMVDSVHSLDSRIKVFGNGTLVVHSVTDKDAGDYLCVARNKIGDDYVVLKVNVMMKPAKIEHKNVNNHKVMYGGDLKVDCVATGLPNPEISWSLPDGSMVNTLMQSDDSGSRAKRYVVFNNGTLYFNEVGLREEGDYTCYAENQIGKDEMKVRVKVVAEPASIRNKTFTVINVPYGDVVSVGCEAKGEPTPKVTWLSPSNRPIPLLSDKYQVYRDGTLLIQKAQRSDSGNYTCIARNSAGEDRKIVLIHINVQPPRINGYSSTITSVRETALKDSRKLVDCKAEGIPSPRVMWAFPEGVILPAPYYGNRITVHRNGTLDIRGVRQTDSVQLVCIGRNEGGEARLIVQLQVSDHVEKPTFRDPVTEKITATAGHSINLNCSVHGNPQPSTAWILPNGTELQRASHLHRFYHKRDGILHISALSGTDAGTYRCLARNPGGSAERVVFLKVGLKPEISNQYNNLVSIINGETLQLHCVTQPSQRARITWTLPNGMVLDSPQTIGRFSLLENGTLTVREASVFDRGTYLCKVATEYGSSLMNVPVIVIAYPPRITSEPAPVIYARPGNTVKLNCMAIGIPKAEITWELPDKSHLTTGAQSRLYGNKFLHPQGSLIIQQATQRDAGFYKCTAKNILGSDSKATYIHIF